MLVFPFPAPNHFRGVVVAAVAVFAIVLGLSPSALGATIVVNDPDDNALPKDDDPVTPANESDGDKCTLRKALQNAFGDSNKAPLFFPSCAAGSGEDTIVISAKLGEIKMNNLTKKPEDAAAFQVSSPVTIKGQVGKPAINARHLTRAFRVGTDTKFALQTLSIYNGEASKSQTGDSANTAGSGGAILFASGSGTFTAEDVDFIGNRAKQFGGAIFASGQKTTLKHSLFVNNRAGAGAGALRTTDGAMVLIEGTRFENNTTSWDFGIPKGNTDGLHGGAIRCFGGGSIGWLSISDSDFVENGADVNETADLDTIYDKLLDFPPSLGGAIMSDCRLHVVRSRFRNNTSDQGGAIAVGTGTPDLSPDMVPGGAQGALIDATLIADNYATGTPIKAYPGEGGGIKAEGSVTVLNSTIKGNVATSPTEGVTGGGIYFDHIETTDPKSTIANTTITGNKAVAAATFGPKPTSGAGVTVRSDATILIRNTTIRNNAGDDSGLSELHAQLGYGGLPRIYLWNSLVAAPSGGKAVNCDGEVDTIEDAAGVAADFGHNRQGDDTDASCGPTIPEVADLDAMLSLGSWLDPSSMLYDGSQIKHEYWDLLPYQNGDPAKDALKLIGNGDVKVCETPPVSDRDQIGKPRVGPGPNGKMACDIGAIEAD